MDLITTLTYYKTNNLSEVIPNTHLLQLSLRSYFLNHWKSFAGIWDGSRWPWIWLSYNQHRLPSPSTSCHEIRRSWLSDMWSPPFLSQRAWIWREGNLGSYEWSLHMILWSHSNLVIARETIYKREQCMSNSVVYKDINIGKQEIVFGTGIVQISVTDTTLWPSQPS